MGFAKSQRPIAAPGIKLGPRTVANLTTAMGPFNMELTFAAATNGVKFGRFVKIKAGGVVVPTTGSSGRMGLGVSLSSGASGSNLSVRITGVANVVAATAAVAIGSWVRGASGPSTGVNAGAAKATTGIAQSCMGIAVTSAAAGAVSTGRTVKVVILHPGQVLA